MWGVNTAEDAEIKYLQQIIKEVECSKYSEVMTKNMRKWKAALNQSDNKKWKILGHDHLANVVIILIITG